MTDTLNILHTMLHTWTDEEVSEAWKMIANEGKRRQQTRIREIKSTLCVGDKVEYQSQPHGTTTGRIIKVKRKKALVDVNGKTWNVPMSMLTKI